MQKYRLSGACSTALGLGLACLSLSHSAPAITMSRPAEVSFVPYHDPWPAALERWWDINNNQFNDWITDGAPNGKFSYAVNPHVTLTYDKSPAAPFFIGHIDATDLKPNFCYQLKLVGKPVFGSRGMGRNSSYVDFAGMTHKVGNTSVNGDDWANEQIGYAGRWWDDNNHAPGTNLDDSYYLDYYRNPVRTGKPAPSSPAIHTVYGYHFMGSFVTNGEGEAHTDFTGRFSYHVDWAAWQGGNKNAYHGTFPLRGWLSSSNPTSYYAYGPTAPLTAVSLYYEYQSDRPQAVHLAPGTYHCRFILTEESFHNSSYTPLGGYWKSVLATEDFDAAGRPDRDATNDVVFSISKAR